VRRTRALLFGVLLALLPTTPAIANQPELAATLDGRPIPVSAIPKHDCHDLEFPIVRCFGDAATRDLAVSAEIGIVGTEAVTAVAYVTIYDLTGFAGSSFVVSQNYDVLATIGWNDRVSSFKGRNSETGRFNVDWFAGGSSWSFCCNQQVASLGSFNNAFSSVYRT
jgi:hypothetical protein